ncbi:MAG: DUF4147 domain-containing protein [Gemmatimonadota bacterium]
MITSTRELLEEVYRAAVAAVEPGRAMSRALAHIIDSRPSRLHVIAIGKAASSMARAACDFAGGLGRAPEGGIAIGVSAAGPGLTIKSVIGDHPIPGAASLAAASALEQYLRSVNQDDEVWVLLSGGASSLIASPVDHVAQDELVELYRILLGSGLDIHRVNRVRKRFSRWSAGRMAAAIAPAVTRVFAISDVSSDEPASIGSGPLSPDPTLAAEVRAIMMESLGVAHIGPSLDRYLGAVESGQLPETPKLGDAIFDNVSYTIIAGNHTALEGARVRAESSGCQATIGGTLTGDAGRQGHAIARQLDRIASDRPHIVLWGGETTVTLPASSKDEPGAGGRCQHLALAAALHLSDTGNRRITLLAAGTDGRDGPTDAAGAIIDGETVGLIRRAGLDPGDSLAAHDSYRALESAHALFKPGLTGTNVMDLVIGLVEPG